jgi:hypothetical protein
LYLSEDFICLRSHGEVIFMQAADLVGPPLKLPIASIPKNLVHRRFLNLIIGGNHKIKSLSLLG